MTHLDPNFVIEHGDKFLVIGAGEKLDFNSLPKAENDKMLVVIVENQSFKKVSSVSDLSNLIIQHKNDLIAQKKLEFFSLPIINL